MCLTSPNPPSIAMKSSISSSGQTVKWGLETRTFSVQTTYSETPCCLVWFSFDFVTIFQMPFYMVLKDTARNTRAAFSGAGTRTEACRLRSPTNPTRQLPQTTGGPRKQRR